MTVIKSYVHIVVEITLYTIFLLSLFPVINAISASIRSEVEGEGFHRNLKYYVDTGNFQNQSCHIAIFVQLPPSLYVNVDELADHRRIQKITSCSDGEVDVELFAEKAHYQNVSICSRLTNSKTTLTVPIHQRYQFASSTGDPINVSLTKPSLLIGCRDRLKEHRVSKIKICWPCIEYARKWRDVSYKWEGDGNFMWQIPVGNTSQRFQVTCITLLVTFSGAAYVLWTIFNSFKVPKKEKVKDN